MIRPFGQVAAFRVFPESRSGLFYRVRLFDSERALGQYLRSDDIDRSAAYGARALCSRWTRTRTTANGRTRTMPDMGEILFVVRSLDAEVVSHEVGHAAIGWAQRIGIRPFGTGTDCQYAGPDEERYCYALGRMVLQVTERVAALRARSGAPSACRC
jgi:hypothetical protein